MTRRTAAFLLVSVATLPVWGQGQAASNDDLAHGRIRYVEPGVAVQRPDEAGAEEAMANTPFLPGDRVWSDASGRAELQFPDGSAVRLDRRSKLDYLEHEGGRTDELVVLNLWSGSVYLRVRDDRRHADFVIETPDGRVEVRTPGNYRVDVENETRVRVYEGEARLESGRRSVRVESDETSTARRGEAPARSADFDAEDVQDDFSRWDERRGAVSWQADSLRYLPEEVQPYAADFDTYGQWHYEVEVGYVWRPRVGAGWRPYSDGRWVWTTYGWTWVPSESWGWAPSHYGRWGQSASLGWYWIPGRQWGPAWVSWRAGGDYVGWCALGRGDRPVNDLGSRGLAVARGLDGRAGSQHGGGGWFYARRTDMGARDIARRRVELDPITAAQAAPIDSTRMRLNRESRAVEHDDRAVPRNTRTRATVGDFVPELRYDPLTTISPAVPRRRPNGEERRDTRTGAEGTRAPVVNESAAEQRQPSRHDAGEPDGRRSTGSSARPGRSTGGDRESDSATERRRRAPADDPEVLRHFFTPLVEPRGETARTHRERGSQDEGEKRAPQGNSDTERRPRQDNADTERRTPQGSSDAERRAPQHATPRREPDRQPEAQSAAPHRDDSQAAARQPRKDHDRRD
jgi:FecR protein